MNAQHLAAMEALVASEFRQFGSNNPGPGAAVALEADFQGYIDAMTVRLLSQSWFSSFLITATEAPGAISTSATFSHPYVGCAALTYNPNTNALSGDLNTILGFYVHSLCEESTEPLNIDDTIALLRMLQVDFGSNETAYRAAIKAAFVAAGFEDAVAAGYADRAVEPRLRVTNGTEGDDTISGFDVDDVIAGGGGNDALWGLNGDDTLEGGPGDDTLYGQQGDDRLEGGPGDDTLYGQQGDDRLEGGPGDDTLYGWTGDDTLTGGTGDDWLEGGRGADTYVFNRGDGVDSIRDHGLSHRTDRLVIHGYAPAEVTVSRTAADSDDLVLTFAGTQDRITVWNGLGGSDRDTIERIEFDDGTVWTPAVVRERLLSEAATEGDDTIWGSDVDDTIAGGGGNDTLYGQRGDDTLEGGAGDDTLEGQRGDDRLIGGADDDTLYGWTGDDTLEGGAGDDTLSGWFDDDTLTGGTGDDWLEGGRGADTYVFNRGDGVDSIQDLGSYSGTDRLVIHGYTPAEVTVSRTAADSDDLVLTFAGTQDRITIWNGLGGSDRDTIERIEFDDGTVWTPAVVRERLLSEAATEGDDTIWGFDVDDTIAGGGGNDALWGLNGDDTLEGDHAAQQRPRCAGRRDRGALQAALAGRALLQVGQAEPEDPALPGCQRECGAHPDRYRADRLSAAAARAGRDPNRTRPPGHRPPRRQDNLPAPGPHRPLRTAPGQPRTP